jgi:ribulose-5-phosphate 4-epimerase/fuculose-1-phosphate aldolase
MENIETQFVEACHKAADAGLLVCSSGNLSWRLDRQHMLVTRTRCWLSEVTPADIAICTIADGTSLNGVRPTVEASFHAGILRNRPDVNVVLHYQSPNATALACCDISHLDFNLTPEIPYYIGPIAHVPFEQPGSIELASAVIAALSEHNLAILQNHGQVVVAADFPHALQNAIFFEMACGIILKLGDKAIPLPPTAVADLYNTTKV